MHLQGAGCVAPVALQQAATAYGVAAAMQVCSFAVGLMSSREHSGWDLWRHWSSTSHSPAHSLAIDAVRQPTDALVLPSPGSSHSSAAASPKCTPVGCCRKDRLLDHLCTVWQAQSLQVPLTCVCRRTASTKVTLSILSITHTSLGRLPAGTPTEQGHPHS